MRWHVGILLALLTGCTVVDVARVPSARDGKDIFITSGDLNEPYESVGLLQVTRRGIRWFGAADFAGTDLDSGFRDVAQQVRTMGGHGIINVRWRQSQYAPVAQVMSVLILGLLPGEVTITGEVVRVRGAR